MRKCMSVYLRYSLAGSSCTVPTYGAVCLRPMPSPITSATVTDFHSRSVPHVAGPLPYANVLGKVGRQAS